MIAGTAVGPAAFAVFLVPMSEDLGWRRDVLTGGLAAGTLAGAAVAPWIGRLVDRHGARVMLTLGGVGLGISMLGIAAAPREAPWVFYAAFTLAMLALLAATSLPSALAYGALYGVAYAGHEVMDAVAWAAYFGTRSLGAIRGMGRPMLLAGNAAGPVVVGAVFESTGSYSPAILGLALLGVVAAVLAAALRPRVQVQARLMPRGT